MSSRKYLVLLLLFLWQMAASSAVQAVSQNSDPSLTPTTSERKVPCSTAEFNYFFRVFVRGLDDVMPRSVVRKAHVWSQVEVRSYQDPRKLLATVPQEKYDGFKIGLLYNLWIYLDPQIPSYSDSYPRLQVNFKTINRRKVRVEYRQAEYVPIPKTNRERLVRTFGEPGAYIFEHREGCWRLTQELRSSKTVASP
jgi:hypothetical protein